MDNLEDLAPRDAAPQDQAQEPEAAAESRASVRTPVTELFAGSFD